MILENHKLKEVLYALEHDKAQVINLYKELYSADFCCIGPEEEWIKGNKLMLSYDTHDNLSATMIFTSHELPVAQKYYQELADHGGKFIKCTGPNLWPYLKEITQEPNTIIEVDTGETHGIHITHEMILGMINEYGIE